MTVTLINDYRPATVTAMGEIKRVKTYEERQKENEATDTKYCRKYGEAAFLQMQRYMSGKDDYDVRGNETQVGQVEYRLQTIQTNSLVYRLNFSTPYQTKDCLTFFRLSTTDPWCPVNRSYFEQLKANTFAVPPG